MKFTLMMTDDCNLRCSYCYEGGCKLKRYMNRETADKCIEFIKEKLKEEEDDKRPLWITLHGGEPLMNFDIVKYIKKKLDSEITDRSIIYDMTTNGTIMSDEILNFIKNDLTEISISLDGTRESHDANRIFPDGSGSYDIVMKNIERLQKENIPIRCRMTFNQQNVYNMYESIESVSKLGFRYIATAVDTMSEWSDERIEEYKEQRMKLIDFQLENPELKLGVTNIRLLNVKRGDCFGGVCTFCIDTDGGIYPCTFSIGKKEYLIGNIYDEVPIDEDRLKEFTDENFRDFEECSGCTRKEYCVSVRCRIVNKLSTGSYSNIPYIACIDENMNFETTKRLLKARENGYVVPL